MAKIAGFFPIGDTGEQFVVAEWYPDPEIIEAELLKLADELDNWTVPLTEARAAAIYDTELHFETESDPSGNKWTALDPDYADSKRKRESAHPDEILQLTGDLKNAATDENNWFITERSIVFNTGALPEYGEAHQRGTAPAGASNVLNKIRTNQFLTREEAGIILGAGRGMNLPQRQFLGLNEETILEIEGIFVDWFNGNVDRGWSGPVGPGGQRGIITNIPSGSGTMVRGPLGRFIGRTSG